MLCAVQVDGCGVSLLGASVSCKRLRLCPSHLSAPELLYDGVLSRFCQPCNRMHPLAEFEGTKKGCRDGLKAHAIMCRAVRARAKARKASTSGSAGGPFAGTLPSNRDSAATTCDSAPSAALSYGATGNEVHIQASDRSGGPITVAPGPNFSAGSSADVGPPMEAAAAGAYQQLPLPHQPHPHQQQQLQRLHGSSGPGCEPVNVFELDALGPLLLQDCAAEGDTRGGISSAQPQLLPPQSGQQYDPALMQLMEGNGG